jgi:exonuclease SbcC
MIDSLEIENFQSWRKVSLYFSKGLNVITGDSDKGKSAIVKAMEWSRTNRPLALPFKSHFAGENDIVRVAEQFDDGSFVVRYKGENDIGGYLTPDHGKDDPLEALKFGVPEEVAGIINIDSYNVHGQDDKYFLLGETSGEVARQLNSIVGLDIIDESGKKINSIISTSKEKLADTKKLIETKSREIEQFDKVPKLDEMVTSLGNVLAERQDMRQERRGIWVVVSDLDRLSGEIETLELWLEIEDELQGIFKEADQMRADISIRDTLVEIVGDVGVVDEEIAELDGFIEPDEKFGELVEEVKDHKRDVKVLGDLRSIVGEYYGLEDDVNELLEDIGGLESDERDLKKSLTVCPTCKQKLTEKAKRELIG